MAGQILINYILYQLPLLINRIRMRRGMAQ